MRTKIIIAAVAVVVLVAVYFLFFHKKTAAKVAPAKVGSQKVSGSSNSITSLAISGIKSLTSSPTNVGSSSDDDDSSSDDDDDS